MTIAPPRAARGPLLLFDIGGYTSFLQAVATAHADDAFADGAVPPAYAILSSLLDGIVEAVVPPTTLSKLEGDAVFVYGMDAAPLPGGAAFLAWLRGTYAAFADRLEQVRELWSCTCAACIRVEQLDLTAVVHAGPFVLSGIAFKLGGIMQATIVLIVAPFVLGFTDQTVATVLYVVIGAGGLGATLLTRFEPDPMPAARIPAQQPAV